MAADEIRDASGCVLRYERSLMRPGVDRVGNGLTAVPHTDPHAGRADRFETIECHDAHFVADGRVAGMR